MTADYDGDGVIDPDSYVARQQKFKDAATLQAWFADNCVTETVTGDLVEPFLYFDYVLDYYEEFSGSAGGAGGAGIAPGITPDSAPARRLQDVDYEIPESLTVCRDNSGLMEELVEFVSLLPQDETVCYTGGKSSEPLTHCSSQHFERSWGRIRYLVCLWGY